MQQGFANKTKPVLMPGGKPTIDDHVRKSQKYQRFIPKKDTVESFNFIGIKSPLGYTPAGFSLSGFQRMQPPFIPNSQPHVAIFLSPLAEGSSLSDSPATYCPLEPVISPQSSEVQPSADPCPSQEENCLDPFQRHYTHNFTHQIIYKDIACIFPLNPQP